MHAGDAISEAQELEEVLVDVTVAAIAEAISFAVAGDSCFAGGEVVAQTLECADCVKRGRRCAGMPPPVS